MKINIQKLVTGGQGLGILPDGRKIFVWNALPGETVEVELVKEKRSFAEGIAIDVLKPSPERIAPKEDEYLATSPWQILTEDAEGRYKVEILREQFLREHLPTEKLPKTIITNGIHFGYRNKVEFSFTEENSMLRLSVTGRRSHEKIAVDGSMLARPELIQAAQEILLALQKLNMKAEHLGHLTLRCSSDKKVVGSLIVHVSHFSEFPLPQSVAGFEALLVSGYDRNRRTKTLWTVGDTTLKDILGGESFHYGVKSFFQVNLPLYEMVLADIRAAVAGNKVVELYAGVGSIGLSTGAAHVTLVDIDRNNTYFAEENLRRSSTAGEVVASSSEAALDYITAKASLIVDPPRAGLSPLVVSRILEVAPSKLVYLSCDPATLARDVAKLSERYSITSVQVYNFFPRTPHVETLVVLEST